MNTDVLVLALAGANPACVADAESVFHDVEARFSRFRPDSELSRFNARTSDRVAVSPQMLDLIELARDFHAWTGGLFEPAVLPQLEAAGYDRSFDLVAPRGDGGAHAGTARATIADLQIERGRGACAAPPKLRLDFGGIGKGYTVDIAAERMRAARDFLIDAGGDMFASGDGPYGDGWCVGVWDPFGGPDIETVILHDQGIATSTTLKRRWQRDGRWRNHLIDPRTGRPTESAVVSASVIAGSATEADVYAKCALLLGPGEAREFIESRGAEALFVLQDGTIHRTGRWPGAPTNALQESRTS
jgi:thiamine biosynthesis lipoprotein